MLPSRLSSWILVISLACLPSCSVPSDGKQAVKIITIRKSDLSKFVDPIDVDTLQTANPDSNLIMHVVDDKLCKLYFKKESRPLRIEIGDLSRDTILYLYQSEKNQLIMPFAKFSWNSILVHDPLRLKTVLIDVYKASGTSDYSPIERTSNLSAIEILSWGDRQVFLNDYSFIDGIPRICFTDKKWNYKQKQKYSFNSSNVVHGVLICNNTHTKLAYIPSNDNKIEIMGGKGEKEIILDFFHEKRQAVAAIKRDKGVFYVFRFPPVLCFSKACAGNRSFIAGYIDDGGNHSVAIIDWNGNLLGGFKVAGEIMDLSYSKDEKSIYTFERTGNKDCLIKYESPFVFH